MRSYLAMIRPLDHDHFCVEYPDLPGCKAMAPSFVEAQRLASPLLNRHLLKLQTMGKLVPAPRTMVQLREAGIVGSAWSVLIPANL